MARGFSKGEKAKVEDLTPARQLQVGVAVDLAGSVDISCFGVDEHGKLSDDRYFIFYNQRSSPEGAVVAKGASGGELEAFDLDLSRLPTNIRRLVFTATTDGASTMSAMRGGHLRLSANGVEVARFALSGSDFAAEKAIIIGEVYFKDVWRFAAVGQGFNGGLSALLTHFGGEELASVAAPPPVPSAPPTPPPSAPTPPPPSAAPSVNLSKITLDKSGDSRTVSLRKGGSNPIHINLNWNQQGGKRRGFLSAGSSAPDLDLGCMWQLRSGEKGVIQPLGGRFGNRNGEPWILLDKDDRSGAAADGENLYIFRPEMLSRVMVFGMIYEGANDFTSVGGRMTIRDQDGAETVVQLNNPDSNRTFCSICLIEPRGESVVITKEERYFPGHKQADNFYGFGFSWTAGRK